jgi:tRNA-dihydrouridine synthase
MAGVTNVAFRTLCRELELSRAGTVSGLYVCEMVTARALVERHPVTMHMTTFGPDESPRSLQLYTVDPANTYAAAKMIVEEGLADHIYMNFGCPVPKVTRRGGGAALPYKRKLFGQIVAAAVRAAMAGGRSVVLVDVRANRTGECVAGSLHMPLSEISTRVSEFSDDQLVVAWGDGGDATHAVLFFRERGIEDSWTLQGGVAAWKAAGGAVERA